MACRSRVGLIFMSFLLIFSSSATASPGDFKLHQSLSPIHKAVSEAADVLISTVGWSDNEVKISHIDTIDAKYGDTVMYEFDIELGGKDIALRVAEDIPVWEYIEELSESSDDASASEARQSWPWQDVVVANLGSFQLSGPVELSMQDAELLRLEILDDIDDDIQAGHLKKVLLAEGVVVTVEGAREVSLLQPLQLPLSLPGISRDDGLAASLLTVADRLRYASRRAEKKPLLSLEIVGATTMVASSTYPSKSSLKVEMLAHGAIKLESQEKQERDLTSTVSLHVSEGENAWLWPSPSLNVSDSKLKALEEVILSAMGPSVYKKGYFNLQGAKVSMATFVQVNFQLERKLSESSFPPGWPEWRTKPSVERLEFEMLARVEGEELVPTQVKYVKPYANAESWTWSALMGKELPHKRPRVFMPPSTLTLNPNWGDMMD